MCASLYQLLVERIAISIFIMPQVWNANATLFSQCAVALGDIIVQSLKSSVSDGLI